MQTITDSLQTSYRDILKVALPMSFGALIQFVVAFTDNYFVAKINGEAMSAVSYVGLIYITLAMIGYGLGNAVQILVARRKGEQLPGEIASTTANAMWLALITSVVQFGIILFVVPLSLDHVIQSDTIRGYMREFIPLRAIGFFFYTMLIMINSFWSGIAITRVLAYTTLITATVNIALDYVLVFGHFGFPEMGVQGAALATSISEACALIYALIYTARHSAARPYPIFKSLRTLPLHHTMQFIRLGGPIAMQLVISLGIWVVFYNFVEKLGAQSMQSAFIVRNMYMLAWVSVMGMSTTTKTFVSGLIAEKRQSEIVPVVKRIISLNICGIVILTHGLLLYPELIASLFTEDAWTISLTVKSAYIVFPAILTFGITSILLSTVEGSGNTMAGFLIELLTTFFYIAASWYLAVYLIQPVYIVWMADYVYFVMLGLLSLIYLRNGKWKHTSI